MTKIISLAVFLVIICNLAIAGQVGLLSTSSNEVSQGDLVEFKIIDSRSKKYFKRYENKRIGELVYVLDVYEKDQEYYFEAIISEIGPKEKLENLEDQFVIKGLNYVPTKKQKPLMDFITLNIPIEISKNKTIWIVSIAIILLFLLSIYWWKTKDIRREKKRQQKHKEEKQKQIQSLFDRADSTDDLAQIYIQRNEIKHFFDIDEAIFNKAIKIINEYQYKPQWPDNEKKEVMKLVKSVKEGMREKRGI